MGSWVAKWKEDENSKFYRNIIQNVGQQIVPYEIDSEWVSLEW